MLLAQGEEDTREIPAAVAAPKQRDRVAHQGTRFGTKDRGGGARTRLFIGVGRQAGIRPGDLVGAITGEAGIPSRDIGAIEIADRFALVEVPDPLADTIIDALRATTIKGRKATVRRERPQ